MRTLNDNSQKSLPEGLKAFRKALFIYPDRFNATASIHCLIWIFQSANYPWLVQELRQFDCFFYFNFNFERGCIKDSAIFVFLGKKFRKMCTLWKLTCRKSAFLKKCDIPSTTIIFKFVSEFIQRNCCYRLIKFLFSYTSKSWRDSLNLKAYNIKFKGFG